MVTCCLSEGAQCQQPRAQIRHADALEHSHDSPVHEAVAHALEKARVGDAGHLAPREVRKTVDEKAEQEDQQAATDDLVANGALVVTARTAGRQRQVRRDPRDEQEERKDQVGGRPPIPWRVLERRIDVLPCPRIVHQQHAGDGHSTKDIKRQQPFAWRSACDGYVIGSRNGLSRESGLSSRHAGDPGKSRVCSRTQRDP